MQALTSAVLAAFVAYAASWYFGYVEGNFALLLFVATVVTGAYWLAERFYFLPQRQAALRNLEEAKRKQLDSLVQQGIAKSIIHVEITEQEKQSLLMQPWWLDWTAGLFPVIISVFFLRSFVVEPFKIPSGSMIPTLLVGDLILVNKFTYGLRIPVLNTKITEGTPPKRGDVMVFRYPPNPSLDYIKRVVGVPGDRVDYINKRLTINGQPLSTVGVPDFLDKTENRYYKQFEEVLGDKKHKIIFYDDRMAGVIPELNGFERKPACTYSVQGVSCTVPEGYYFMMGDNRDNSTDSRYWGFVPEKNIVGKAFFVWMHFFDFSRIGSFD
jgi:signal peptidase I